MISPVFGIALAQAGAQESVNGEHGNEAQRSEWSGPELMHSGVFRQNAEIPRSGKEGKGTSDLLAGDLERECYSGCKLLLLYLELKGREEESIVLGFL